MPTPSLQTARLDLVPLVPADAAEMVGVLADPSLYLFIGGQPPRRAELHDRYRRLAVGRSEDGSEAWHNWIVCLRPGRRAVGTVQATVSTARPEAEIAWVIGAPWQGNGYASEAALALVGWLEASGATSITALIHPDHGASEGVARRAGLLPTDLMRDGERVWRRPADQG